MLPIGKAIPPVIDEDDFDNTKFILSSIFFENRNTFGANRSNGFMVLFAATKAQKLFTSL